MKYIKVINDLNHIYPYSDSQFRRDNANVSFPSIVSDETKASYQVYPVIEEPSPTYNEATQRIVRQQPQLINNQWTVKWVIVDKTEEEQIQYREDQIRNVKAEANRRIIAIAPEWRQRNMIARSVELLSIGKDAWTQEQRDENLALELVWETVKMIRAKSDQLEAMNPIPEDFKDDKYWI
jgi:hypothetical protein